MQVFDTLVLPKCRVAEEAIYCWHDIIKNRIGAFADPFLGRWLDDTASAERFENALNGVIDDLEGFSPVRAIEELQPLTSMTEPVRCDLIANLARVFQRDFNLSHRRERLRAVSSPLIRCLHQCIDFRTDSTQAALFSQLRKIAKTAQIELETLPRGFWLPRFESDSSTG